MMNLNNISVLVMAAARGPDDPMAIAFNATHKCLIDVDGTPMLIRVVNALQRSKAIGTIGVSIDDFDVLEDIAVLDNVQRFASATSAPGSVVSAIDQMESPFPLLVTTADHALLTPEMVEHFCARAQETDCDIAIGLAGRSDIERADKTAKRTYFSFQNGDFSGCNLYYLKSEKALNAVQFWHQVDKIRKQPLKLARKFGLGLLIKYKLGFLTLDKALAQASELLNVRARPVIMPFGEAAIDVDKPEDHVLVEKLLQQRTGA